MNICKKDESRFSVQIYAQKNHLQFGMQITAGKKFR